MQVTKEYFLLICLAIICLLPTAALASTVTLEWDSKYNSGISGYNIHYGTASNTYQSTQWVETTEESETVNYTLTGLAYDTTYFIAVTAVNSVGLESDFSNEVSFTTPSPPDTERPYVISVTPAQGVEVQNSTSILIAFSEPMDEQHTEQAFVLLDSAGMEVSGTFNCSGSNLTFIPHSALQAGETYTISVGTEACDLAGNNLDSAFTSSFSTQAQEVPGDSITVVLEVSDYSDDVSSFNCSSAYLDYPLMNLGVQGYGSWSAGVRFRNAPIPQGAVILSAYLSMAPYKKQYMSLEAMVQGMVQESAEPFDQEPSLCQRSVTQTSSTWQVDAEVKGGVYIGGPEETAPNDVTDVVQELVDGSDWYEGGALALLLTGETPYARFRTFEYWGKPYGARLYVTYLNQDAEPDVDAPSIVSVEPSDGMNDVQTNVRIEVAFSEPMDKSSVELSFRVTDRFGLEVLGDSSWEGQTFYFTPHIELDSGETYTISVTDEAADLAGNNLDSAFTSSFSTQAQEVPGDSITVVLEVSDSSDDVTSFNCGSAYVNYPLMNLGIQGYGSWSAGVRFRNAPIPPGAVILSAYLSMAPYKNEYMSLEAMVQGMVQESSGPFDQEPSLCQRSVTQTSSLWQVDADVKGGVYIGGPEETAPNDVTDVVQELVDGADWYEGGALALLLTGETPYAGFRTFEYWGKSYGAKLYITYTY